MYKILASIFNIAFILGVVLVSFAMSAEIKNEKINTNTFTAEEILGMWYDEACPYGNAIITTSNKKQVLARVDCVQFDYITRTWVTWNGDMINRKNRRSFSPTKVRIFIMDGEVKLVHGHPRSMPYGAITINNPRFEDWIQSH